MTAAKVYGKTLIVEFDTALDTTSKPASSAFAVIATKAGASRTIRGASALVTISGRIVTATLTSAVAADETLRVRYDKPASGAVLEDSSGTALPSVADRSAENGAKDTTAPTLSTATVNGDAATLTFSEALDESVTQSGSFAPFTLRWSPTESIRPQSFSISGRTVRLTLAMAMPHGRTLTLEYARPGSPANRFKDLAGNELAAFTNKPVTNATPAPDTTAPTVDSATVNGNTAVLTFNEELAENAAPASDFRFRVGTSGSGAQATAIDISGRTVTLTLASAVSHGDMVQMQYIPVTQTNIQDEAGNRWSHGFRFGQIVTITNNTPAPDTTRPSLVSATVNRNKAVLTFNEALKENAAPASSFSFRVGTSGGGAAATRIAISGRTVTLTLGSAVTHGQTVQMQYTAGTQQIQDLAGNNWAASRAFGADTITNNTPLDTTGPTLVSATVNGSTVVLTFNEDVDTNAVPGLFRFRTDTSSIGTDATGIAISGRTVKLTLGSAVTRGQTVQMQYTFSRVDQQIRDLAGNGWSTIRIFGRDTITNITGTTPRPVSVTVNGTTLTITLSHDLDTDSVPAASAFTVRAGARKAMLVPAGGTPPPVAVSGKTVTLTLAVAVAAHEKVTVRYDRPASGRLRTVARTVTQSFANLAAANVTPTAATRIKAVKIESARSTADTYGPGRHVQVRVTWSADVAWNVPAGGDLSVRLDVGGSVKLASLRTRGATSGRARSLVFRYQVQAADTDNNGLELTPNAAGDLVVLSGGATLLDAQGRAASRSHPGLSGGANHKVDGSLPAGTDTTPPDVVHAAVDGATVTLTFDEELTVPSPEQRTELRLAFTIQGGRHQGAVIVNQGARRVEVSGSTVTLTLAAPIAAHQPATLVYHQLGDKGGGTDHQLRDAAGTNKVAEFSRVLTNVTPPAQPPVLLRGQVEGSTLALVFDRALDAASLPSGSRFRVSRVGSGFGYHAIGTGKAVIRGATAIVTLVKNSTPPVALGNTLAGSDDLWAFYDKGDEANPLRDAAGVEVEDIALFRIHHRTGDRTAPTSPSASVSGKDMTLYFDEALDESSIPLTSAFSVRVGTGSREAPEEVVVRGTAVFLTLATPVGAGDTATVRYTAPAAPAAGLRDLAGNRATTFFHTSTLIKEGTDRPAAAPALAATTPTTSPATMNGNLLTLVFDQALDPTKVPDKSAFALDQKYTGVNLVTVRGKEVDLQMVRSAQPCDTFKLAYARPPANALQNRWGMEAGAFAGQAVANADAGDCTASGAGGMSANRERMTMSFQQPLEKRAAPATAHFTVTPAAPAAAPVPVIDAAFAANGGGVELTLGRALADGEGVTVHYRRPQGEMGLWTATHSQLADFDVEGVAGAQAAATGVAVVSDPGDDATYAAGDKVRVQVTFGEAVDVDTTGGTPRLKLDLGGDDGAGERWAAYESGSGTDTLAFAWTAAAPDEAADGIAVLADTLELNGGTIRAKATQADAALGHAGLAADAAHKVDAAPPRLVRGEIDGGTMTLFFSEALDPEATGGRFTDRFHVTLQTSETEERGFFASGDVAVDGETVTVGLGEGNPRAQAGLTKGNRLHHFWRTDGLYGAFRDLAGNLLASDAAGIGVRYVRIALANVTGGVPHVTGVAVSSDGGADKTYALGEVINIRVTFSEAVDVTGAPRLKIDMDPAHWGEKWAAYASGSGTTTLTFAHTVVEPNISTQGIAVLANTMVLNGGTIRSGGADADLTHIGLAHDPDHKVDWRTEPASGGDDNPEGTSGDGGPPSVTGVSVVSSPASGDTYMLGETIRVRVSFDAAVSVTGSPGLSIDMDPAAWGEKRAAYASGGGTSSLTFSHTVVEPNYSTQGIAVLANTLALNGGTIRSAASGTDAALGHSGLGHNSGHKVDWRPVISVADAQANEGAGAISFEVSLSRAFTSSEHRVTVDYATADGTATAGEDYTATYGILIFAAGETEKTVSVPILDDAVDEGEETFTLRLSNATGGRIGDGEATGTISNDDPLQKMWLSRFGRTVADHVTSAVSDRLSGPLTGGQVTVGGQTMNLAEMEDDAFLGRTLTSIAQIMGAPSGPGQAANDDGWPGDPGAGSTGTGHAGAGPWPGTSLGLGDTPVATSGPGRLMTGRELLLGSAFHLAKEGDGGGPGLAAWGRVTVGGFDGEAPSDSGSVRIDGNVTTGILGADAEWRRLLAGVAVSVSEGEGTFDQSGVDSGTIESTMTTVSPYARVSVNERISVWGLAGYGTGDMTIVQKANKATGQPERISRTDLSMRLAALGGRGVLLQADEAGGFDLALKADGFYVETTAEAISNEGDTTADASRVRLALEGSRAFRMGDGVLTPGLELGVRHDGGDAETGTGVELGGRVSYTDPDTGLTVEGRVRALIAHEDSKYREWGASGAVRLAPSERGRGLSFSLAPTYGAPGGGVDRLWSARDARGLAPNGAGDFGPESRLEGELGYGMGLFGDRFTGTPNVGFGLTGAGSRDYRIGWRFTSAVRGDPGFEVTLDATRREPANDNGAGTPVEHGVMLRAGIRW